MEWVLTITHVTCTEMIVVLDRSDLRTIGYEGKVCQRKDIGVKELTLCPTIQREKAPSESGWSN
jgi:hypothetical protein